MKIPCTLRFFDGSTGNNNFYQLYIKILWPHLLTYAARRNCSIERLKLAVPFLGNPFRAAILSLSSHATKRLRRVDSRVVASKALLRLLEPLAGFVLDSGLSIHEFIAIFREAAVRGAVGQQLERDGRINISGIAASTGMSRGEISRIIKSTARAVDLEAGHRPQSTHKVLAAWQQNPKFTNPSGQPADLKLYGCGPTFETLVKKHGGGIPTRAMLDELTRTGAIAINSSQRVQLRSAVAVELGVTPQVMTAFGDRATELLSTLLQNMRNPEDAMFVANISEPNISQDAILLLRQELSTRGANFLADIADLLTRNPSSKRRPPKSGKSRNVSVTVFLNESSKNKKSKIFKLNKRKNFRRVET